MFPSRWSTFLWHFFTLASTVETLEKASEIMRKYKIKKLPVLSDNDIVGVITITDITYARPELTERFMESWVKPRWED